MEDAEKSRNAPSVATCLNVHVSEWTDSPELTPLPESCDSPVCEIKPEKAPNTAESVRLLDQYTQECYGRSIDKQVSEQISLVNTRQKIYDTDDPETSKISDETDGLKSILKKNTPSLKLN